MHISYTICMYLQQIKQSTQFWFAFISYGDAESARTILCMPIIIISYVIFMYL